MSSWAIPGAAQFDELIACGAAQDEDTVVAGRNTQASGNLVSVLCSSDVDARERRAQRRRAERTGDVVSLGSRKPALNDDLTASERLLAVARLNLQMWPSMRMTASSRAERAQWPSAVIDLRHRD